MTGYLTGPGSDPTWEPIVNNGAAGHLPGMERHRGSHTDSLIVVSAMGDSARLLQRYAGEDDPVRGRHVDGTELAQVIFWAMDPQGALLQP